MKSKSGRMFGSQHQCATQKIQAPFDGTNNYPSMVQEAYNIL